jgi:hypothetical protein
MRVIACVLLLLVASTASAQDATEYRDLRAARPDGRKVTVKDLVLERDAHRITLRSGVVHLLAPLGKDTFGAVFIGEGEYVLNPATSAERRQLQLLTNNDTAEVLKDRFSRLILFFTDRTAAELLAHAPAAAGSPDPAATRAYEDYLNRQRNDDLPNLHLRVLADLFNRPTRTDGVFLAFVEGQSYSPVLLAVDPLGISHITPRFSFYGGEEVALFSFNEMNGGLWYSSTFAPQAVAGRGKPIRLLADASHYEIDTTIDGINLRGTTTVTFTPLTDGIRILPLSLFARLRFTSASIDGPGAPVPLTLLQGDPGDAGSARAPRDESGSVDVAVQFREPLVRGTPVKVTFAYEGRDVVVKAAGSNVYSVGARTSWYPNLGSFDDVATYAMTFRYSSRDDLIAVGEQVSERTEGGQKVAVWRSQTPIRVAGFNYGDYQKRSQTDAQSGISADVYVIRDARFLAMVGTPLADTINTARVGGLYFGPMPFSRISITQQPAVAAAQSWPTLVYLSTISFIGGTDLAAGLGLDPRALQSLTEFGNTVTWHEVAHQWWGHQVGWASYRDQWLSEGFAEFTSALLLEVNSGKKKADAFWEQKRGEIFGKTIGVANNEAGAITQGVRLRTHRSPQAGQAMIYSKGAFVVHMLRMMMYEEGRPDPDAPFKAMMSDFVKTWSGRNPSTDDFKAIAEKHITRDMNLAGDGKLDYFFNQWVHGIDIPALGAKLEATDIGGGKYKIAGTITQSGVPPEFRSRVPIYLDLGNDRLGRLGSIAIAGSSTVKVSVDVALPQKPRRVFINARHEVLAR